LPSQQHRLQRRGLLLVRSSHGLHRVCFHISHSAAWVISCVDALVRAHDVHMQEVTCREPQTTLQHCTQSAPLCLVFFVVRCGPLESIRATESCFIRCLAPRANACRDHGQRGRGTPGFRRARQRPPPPCRPRCKHTPPTVVCLAPPEHFDVSDQGTPHWSPSVHARMPRSLKHAWWWQCSFTECYHRVQWLSRPMVGPVCISARSTGTSPHTGLSLPSMRIVENLCCILVYEHIGSRHQPRYDITSHA